MLTYQVRERLFRLLEDRAFSFPNSAEIVFFLKPLQPFGKSSTGGRTAVRGDKWSVVVDANSGHYFVELKKPLDPLDVVIEEPIRKVELIGNELRITEQVVQTLEELDQLIFSVYFTFPILLNIEFADPPTVERVEVRGC